MTTRIGMMLPGAVSLGAYEGGALAAVLKAVQASDGELVVDSIASASAGSMTGLIACRALLCGADPVELMKRTWVELPQLDRLETHDVSAPLTMDHLISAAKMLLGPDPVPDGPVRQGDSVHVSMALTALGGLTYAMAHRRDPHDPQQAETLLATTYADFFSAELKAGSQQDDFLGVLEGAMASGSTPVGFPPRWLDREGVAGEYRRKGILTPSDKPFALWYSDGGDLDNQPFGRLLDLIEAIPHQGDDERVIVMLNIEPGAPPTWQGTWFDPDHMPSWLSTLLHISHVRTTQSLYDDLRELEKTNRRIAWIKSVAGAVDGSLGEAARQSVLAATAAVATRLAADQQQIDRAIRERAGADLPSARPAAADIEELLLQAAGLDGKSEIVVEVISPDIDPNVHLTAEQQLSGEFLFHFGGFFDPKYRESDFALGYRNARYWLGWWLEGRVGRPAAVLAAVDAGYQSLPWSNEEQGGASVGTLSVKEKVEGIDLLGHIGHVAVHDLDADVAHEVEFTSALRHLF